MFYVIRDDTVYEEEYSELGKGEISVGSISLTDRC